VHVKIKDGDGIFDARTFQGYRDDWWSIAKSLFWRVFDYTNVLATWWGT
jgi:hypothetical protein